MAINFTVYSNGNSSSKAISFDFSTEVLASSNAVSFSSEQRHFFKVTTSAKDEDGYSYQVRLIESDSDLALNGLRWASNAAATAAGLSNTHPYPDITTMIYDYVYDLVNGRTNNQNGSGCLPRAKMDFS